VILCVEIDGISVIPVIFLFAAGTHASLLTFPAYNVSTLSFWMVINLITSGASTSTRASKSKARACEPLGSKNLMCNGVFLPDFLENLLFVCSLQIKGDDITYLACNPANHVVTATSHCQSCSSLPLGNLTPLFCPYFVYNTLVSAVHYIDQNAILLSDEYAFSIATNRNLTDNESNIKAFLWPQSCKWSTSETQETSAIDAFVAGPLLDDRWRIVECGSQD